MRRTHSAVSVLALAAFLFVTSPEVSAQKSTTRGFTLGVHASGASLVVENGEANNGGGGGIRAGYGINRVVTLLLQIDGAQVDVDDGRLAGSWTLGHADLGARFHFASTLRSWVPYLEAAVGGRAVSVSDATVEDDPAGTVSFSGAAFTVGGGISLYVRETLAVDLGLKLSSGEFTQIDVGAVSVSGLDIDANSTRFNVGIAWWP